MFCASEMFIPLNKRTADLIPRTQKGSDSLQFAVCSFGSRIYLAVSIWREISADSTVVIQHSTPNRVATSRKSMSIVRELLINKRFCRSHVKDH